MAFTATACIPCITIAQDPLELLLEAEKQSAISPISSADIQFHARVFNPPMSSVAIEKVIKDQAQAIQIQIDAYANNPKIRRIFEEALAKNRDNILKQAENRRQIEITGLFRMFGSGFGSDHYYEVRVNRGTEDPFDLVLLQRRLDDNSIRSISLDSNSRLALVCAENLSVGVTNPINFGRFPEMLRPVIRSGVEIKCRIDGSYVKQSPGETCISFAFSAKNGSSEAENNADKTKSTTFGRIVVTIQPVEIDLG